MTPNLTRRSLFATLAAAVGGIGLAKVAAPEPQVIGTISIDADDARRSIVDALTALRERTTIARCELGHIGIESTYGTLPSAMVRTFPSPPH